MKYYYLDHAATTPLSHEVLEAMLPYLTEEYGNASTLYTLGQHAKSAVESSRRCIAETIGARASEIYFTGGGTESDNWALRGACEMGRQLLSARSSDADTGEGSDASQHCGGEAPLHIITDAIEHHAVLHTCRYLEKQGVSVTYLPVDRNGRVNPADVMAAIRPQTILVSIMAANNEIGTLEPISEIGACLRRHREASGQRILFHTDAVQAYGHMPLSVDALGVDLLSASGHKLNGPKGIGFLYIRRGVQLPALLHGGAQERGLRAGTENTAGIVGLARAAKLACKDLPERMKAESVVRDHLIHRLCTEIPDTHRNGDPVHCLPNNANVCFRGAEAELLLLLLNEQHIYASAGSACASGSLHPSHVLTAIGASAADAGSSLRLTIGPETTLQDIDEVVERMKPLVAQLRRRDGM